MKAACAAPALPSSAHSVAVRMRARTFVLAVFSVTLCLMAFSSLLRPRRADRFVLSCCHTAGTPLGFGGAHRHGDGETFTEIGRTAMHMGLPFARVTLVLVVLAGSIA